MVPGTRGGPHEHSPVLSPRARGEEGSLECPCPFHLGRFLSPTLGGVGIIIAACHKTSKGGATFAQGFGGNQALFIGDLA